MKGVGVLHHEFARTHDAEAWPDLIAELGVDLVVVHRQLPVAAQFPPGDLRDHFLGGRGKAVVALVAVADAQEKVTVDVPASGLLPEFGGLHGGHQDLKGSRAVHFLPDDALDLAQHAQAQRQPRKEAGRQSTHQAGTQHELVTDDLGVGRCFLQGGEG